MSSIYFFSLKPFLKAQEDALPCWRHFTAKFGHLLWRRNDNFLAINAINTSFALIKHKWQLWSQFSANNQTNFLMEKTVGQKIHYYTLPSKESHCISSKVFLYHSVNSLQASVMCSLILRASFPKPKSLNFKTKWDQGIYV